MLVVLLSCPVLVKTSEPVVVAQDGDRGLVKVEPPRVDHGPSVLASVAASIGTRALVTARGGALSPRRLPIVVLLL